MEFERQDGPKRRMRIATLSTFHVPYTRRPHGLADVRTSPSRVSHFAFRIRRSPFIVAKHRASHVESGYAPYLFSTRNVGVWLPPPAVTFSRAAVPSRVRQPSTYRPCATYGAVSTIRSRISTFPSTKLGYASFGKAIRCCTMYGSASA